MTTYERVTADQRFTLGQLVRHISSAGQRPIVGTVVGYWRNGNWVVREFGHGATRIYPENELIPHISFSDRSQGELAPCADKTCQNYRHTRSGSIYCPECSRDA